MMNCPKCGKELPEELSFCPECGAELTAAPAEPETEPIVETPAEPAEDLAEETVILSDETEAEASEEVSEPEDAEEGEEGEKGEKGEKTEETEGEAAESDENTEVIEAADLTQPTKKSNKLAIAVIAVVIALLLAIIACLGLTLKYVSDGGSLSSIFHREKKLKANAIAMQLTDADGNVLEEMNNAEFSFYYWGEFYYFINRNGVVFDPDIPLSEQNYMEANSATDTEAMTWEDYFKENARMSYQQTQALIHAAQAEGFEMPEEFEAQYQSVIDRLPEEAASAGYVDEAGNPDLLGYIQESYGSTATEELFQKYIHDSYYASAYSDKIYNGPSFTDEEISAYYDENAETYEGYGIEKSDLPDVTVRHILVIPEQDETDDDGNPTSSDAAWEAAEQKAKDILDEWKAGDATEDSFAALAQEASEDPGSASNGGMYENVYPGQMVPTFNDWCFTAERKPGDTDIVKSDNGFHIMYFVKFQDTFYWKANVEDELRYNSYSETTDAITGSYEAVLTDKADVRTPDAVTAMFEQYKAQTAQASNALNLG